MPVGTGIGGLGGFGGFCGGLFFNWTKIVTQSYFESITYIVR